MKDKILLYHKNCPDGYGSRWCFERKWGDEMSYIPVAHGAPPPEGLEDKDIWIADFSYPRDILLALKEKNRSITVIDHHKTAEDTLRDLDFCHFDMSHCGAILSWYYCNGLNKEPPLLLKYIEDQDLWKWQMPFAKEILAVIDSYDYSFRLWEELNYRLQDDQKFSEFLAEGSALLRQREKKIKEIYAKKHTLTVFGEEIPAVNSPLYQSELAARVAEEAGTKYGLAYYFDGEGYVFSIRCGKEKDFDVSAIAVKFGGGGHKAASGFKVKDLKELNEIRPENTRVERKDC